MLKKLLTVLTMMVCLTLLIGIDTVQAQLYTSILTLDSIPYDVKSGSTIVFSGQLTTTSGHVIPSATIYIKDDVSFGSDVVIKKMTTDDNGHFYSSIIAEPRSNGAYDFYAVYEGSSNISKSRSQTYSVDVYYNYYDSYQNYYHDSSTSITLNKTPSSVYAGESLTFTGYLTSNGMPLSNALVNIMEDDPFLPDQQLAFSWTDNNGKFSITWDVGAGLVETDFDVYAEFDGDYTYDGARSYNQEISVLKHGGYITLDDFSRTANIGDVMSFSGKLNLEGVSPEGAIVYIKDEDALNPDDLLTTAYVDSYGRFSADWFVSDVDVDGIADVYAVFEGNDEFYRLTTCDYGATRSFGGACSNTIQLSIYDHQIYDNKPYVPATGQYMNLYYSLDFYDSPNVAIVPSPDDYDKVRLHVIPVIEGIRMWESKLTEKYGGNWDVSFEVIKPGRLFFETKPDIIVNLVTHDQDVGCVDEYLGWAKIAKNPQKPITTTVCSTSLGSMRSNTDVSATAAHEFIHAVGLGHTFNKAGDMMCSVEGGKPTCSNLNFKSKTPSTLNLEGVKEIYGQDGFQKPNNNVYYNSKFALGNTENYQDNILSPIKDKCHTSNNNYDSTINDLTIQPGYYNYWTLCSDDPISYHFATDSKYDGFMLYLLPPETDVADFMDDGDGHYYTCEELDQKWHTKSNTCTIDSGAALVLYNDNYDAITVNGYIRN